MYAEQTQAAGQYQGAAIGMVKANPPTAPTLLSALSSMDELNKRLYQVLNQTAEIAQAVGGPYPVGGANAKPETPPQSAMQRLNDGVADAHLTISNLEQAISAIRRSLGG